MDGLKQLQALLGPASPDPDPTALALLVHANRHTPGIKEFLLQLGPGHSYSSLIGQLLVQLHTWLGDLSSAEAMLRSMLKAEPEMDLEHIEAAIRRHIGDPSARISSTYMGFPNAAKQSLGFYRHDALGANGAKRYITKFSTASTMGQEPAFYELIRPTSPQLQSASPVPVLVHCSKQSSLCMLTMEHIAGDAPEIASMDTTALMDMVVTYQALADLPSGPVMPIFSERRTMLEFNHGYLASGMHKIHLPADFKLLKEWVVAAVSERGYQAEVVRSVVGAVETLELQRFHAKVDPDLHYGFLHGDLHRHNVLSTRHGVVFIDWARCTVGPKQIDLATLLRRHGFSPTIALLRQANVWDRMDGVNKTLFALAMIVVSLMIDLPAIKTEAPDHVFLPAARCIHAHL